MSAPAISREAIYAALFARVATLPGLVTVSRRLRHWSDVRAASQPAAFQVQRSETVSDLPGTPPRIEMQVAIYLYVSAGSDESAVPSTALNTLIDALAAALAPDEASSRQTLGGLVYHCRIEGKIETDEGTLGGQAVAIVPVTLLLG